MHHTVIPITLPIIVVAAVVLWRKGPPAGRRYIMTLTLAWVTGVLSVARTSDTVYAYRLFWAWLLAMLSWLVVVWAIAVVLPAERRSALGPRVAAAALAVTVVLAGVNSVSALRADLPLRQESEHIEALLPALEEDLPSDRSSVLFRDHNWPTWWIGFGLKLGLEKSGSVTAATRSVEIPIGRRQLARNAVYVIAMDRNMVQYVGDPRFEFVALDADGTVTVETLEKYVADHGRTGFALLVHGVGLFHQLAPDAAPSGN